MKKIKLTETQLTEIIEKVVKKEVILKEQDGDLGIEDIQDDLLSIPLELRKQLKDDLQQMLGNPSDVDSLESIEFHNNAIDYNIDEQISYKGIPEI